jgi:hypothetical protein
MMVETLAMPQAAVLDLHIFAAGLTSTARDVGGANARQHWLSGDAGPVRWARGSVLPETRDLHEEMLAVLRGQRRG